MTSDSDSSSSSSSSSDDYKKRKSNKKHKKKSEKKHKKSKKLKKHHKEKKRAKRTSTDILPKSLVAVDDGDEHAFGPALPPSLTQPLADSIGVSIGPVLPAKYLGSINKKQAEEERVPDEVQEDDDFTFGPLPKGDHQMSANQIEREKRALELKIAAIEGRDLGQRSLEQKSREEWMLELPDVGLRSGLASLSNMKRTFYAGKEKPDFSDRSAWTKTPQSENTAQQATTSKTSVEVLRSKAEAKYERERDNEQERLAKRHKKKHKREESLVELHQKKLRKEQKEKEKQLAASGAKPERRPFSRDIDLKMNKIDKNQTKQIVDKAKILNTKFSSGKSKYL